jgi:fatty acid desaturase
MSNAVHKARSNPHRYSVAEKALHDQLRTRLKAAGCFDRKAPRYMVLVSLLIVAVALVMALFTLSTGAPVVAYLGACAVWAVAMLQFGFVGHDACHFTVCKSRRLSNLLAFFSMNVMVGLSRRDWATNHDRHHAFTQHVDVDPDLETQPFLRLLEQQSNSQRWWYRFQILYVWILIPLWPLGIQLRSLQRTATKGQWVEFALLLVHYAIFLVLPCLAKGALFGFGVYLLSVALLGYAMAIAFWLNHFGCEEAAPTGRSFMEAQLEGTRSIRCNRVVEFLLGGLNFHNEHHVFPTIPRFRLRKASAVLSAFCTEHGLNYQEMSLWEAVVHVVRHIRTQGKLVFHEEGEGEMLGA